MKVSPFEYCEALVISGVPIREAIAETVRAMARETSRTMARNVLLDGLVEIKTAQRAKPPRRRAGTQLVWITAMRFVEQGRSRIFGYDHVLRLCLVEVRAGR